MNAILVPIPIPAGQFPRVLCRSSTSQSSSQQDECHQSSDDDDDDVLLLLGGKENRLTLHSHFGACDMIGTTTKLRLVGRGSGVAVQLQTPFRAGLPLLMVSEMNADLLRSLRACECIVSSSFVARLPKNRLA